MRQRSEQWLEESSGSLWQKPWTRHKRQRDPYSTTTEERREGHRSWRAVHGLRPCSNRLISGRLLDSSGPRSARMRPAPRKTPLSGPSLPWMPSVSLVQEAMLPFVQQVDSRDFARSTSKGNSSQETEKNSRNWPQKRASTARTPTTKKVSVAPPTCGYHMEKTRHQKLGTSPSPPASASPFVMAPSQNLTDHESLKWTFHNTAARCHDFTPVVFDGHVNGCTVPGQLDVTTPHFHVTPHTQRRHSAYLRHFTVTRREPS